MLEIIILLLAIVVVWWLIKFGFKVLVRVVIPIGIIIFIVDLLYNTFGPY